MDLKRFLKKLGTFDWFLLLIVAICAVGGIACIYSATWTSERLEIRLAYQRQAFWMVAGLLSTLVISFIDYERILKLAWIVLGLGLGILIWVLLAGVSIHGSRSWISLGGTTLQPAEFSKLCFIIFLAHYLSEQGKEVSSFKTFFVSCLVMGSFMLLILKQPDLGSAAVFVPMCFAMMFVAGVGKRWLMLGAVLGVIGFIAAFFFVLETYQKARLITFLNPDFDPKGSGYHLRQSIIAVGSGGLTGKGFMEGTQNLLGFLPRDVSFSDFIFSVIGEEFGFAGSVILLTLFAFILFRGLRIAALAREMKGTLIAVGIIAMFFAHIFENIGMTIGVTPITGIPLPFISYGGSFIMACFIAIGLLQSVHIHRGVY